MNIINNNESGFMQTSESYIGYKQIECRTKYSPFYNFYIAEVEIPKDSLVVRPHIIYVDGVTKQRVPELPPLPLEQLRTNQYKINKIFNAGECVKCRSWYDHNLTYQVGNTYKVDNFDKNPDNISSYGLSFLRDKGEAVNWRFYRQSLYKKFLKFKGLISK
jgi:hypothetical protein